MEMISIIVPIFNTAEFLPRCVDSILSQTYNNFELILINDGSTDGSEDICNEYVRRDSRVRVVNQHNQGAHIARDNGLKIAKGDWIAFVDSDDWIESSMYQDMMEKADTDTDIVWCGVVGGDGSVVLPINASSDELLKLLLKGRIQGWMWNKIIRRKLFDDVDMSGSVMMMEDVFMSVQLLAQMPKIAFVNKPLYHYIIHKGNVTSSGAQVYVKALPNLHLIYRYLDSHNLLEEYKSEFNELCMFFKLALISEKTIQAGRNLYPLAHRKLNTYPLNSRIYKYYYWIMFNIGILGNMMCNLRNFYKKYRQN